MSEQDASAVAEEGLWRLLRAPVDAISGTVIAGIALAGLGFVLAGPRPSGPPVAGWVFEYLFARNEPVAAGLAAAIVLAAVAAAWSRRVPERLFVSGLAADPRAFIVGATLVLAAASLLVYRAHPLSMDEYAPLFQARVFARGRLFGRVPPELLPWLIPPIRWFIEAAPSGALLSAYWPGFALLLTPFVWLGCPWLLNPLLGGATLFLVWRLGRQLWPGTSAPGWAVLLTAASPAFSVNAISYYSMAAHLAAALCFALLVLQGRMALAGVVGSLALALHNPFPHTLFAIPFILFVARRPDGVRNLFRMALGYLPGVLVLIGGWIAVRARLAATGATHAGLLDGFEVWTSAFTAPSLDLIFSRTMNAAELGSWAVPMLVPLAVLGAVWCRQNEGARLLTLSALLTAAGYMFVIYSQGHGWGYRYFHSAWGALPLLAAGALESPKAKERLRVLAVCAGLCSLVLCTALRFAQVRTFIDAHLAQIPAAPAEGRMQVVFVDERRGSYMVDLVQNDPFMETDRWILLSHGKAADAGFMHAFFPRSRRAVDGRAASVWLVE